MDDFFGDHGFCVQLFKENVLESPPDEEKEETAVQEEGGDGQQRDDISSVRSPRGERCLQTAENISFI